MALSESQKEEIIQKLTELLIETDFYEKKKGVEVYVSKKRIYKDLIKYFKEYL
jgi:phenylpyruvate tautomerase PptA (4-oxalocrotonate tautomerase family)